MFCTRLRKDLLLVARRVTLLITGRNEVVAKVMFLLMSVILSTGGGSASVHAGILPLPQEGGIPVAKENPPPRRTPPAKETPQRRWHPPAKETPPERDPQGAPPLPRRPPQRRKHPPAKETPPKKETPQEGGLPPGPHPRGKLRGSDQAHTQGGN